MVYDINRNVYMGVSKNNGTPKSSILIGFSITNHPFWVPLFLETPTSIFLAVHVSCLDSHRHQKFKSSTVVSSEQDLVLGSFRDPQEIAGPDKGFLKGNQ